MKKYGSLGESSCNCKKYGVYGWQRCWKGGLLSLTYASPPEWDCPPPGIEGLRNLRKWRKLLFPPFIPSILIEMQLQLAFTQGYWTNWNAVVFTGRVNGETLIRKYPRKHVCHGLIRYLALCTKWMVQNSQRIARTATPPTICRCLHIIWTKENL